MATHTGSPTSHERHVVHHHDDDASSAGMVAILLIAAVLVIGFILFALQAFPFGATVPNAGTDINLPDVSVPATPDVNVDQNNVAPLNPVE